KVAGAIILVLTLCTTAGPNTILSGLIEDLSRYIGAAARLTTNVVAGLDKVQAAEIPAGARQQASENLQTISDELLRLKIYCGILVDSISEYTDRAERQKFSTQEQARLWRSILSDIERHSRFVSSILNTLETSKWLNVVLDAKDRTELRSMLIGRNGLLDRI